MEEREDKSKGQKQMNINRRVYTAAAVLTAACMAAATASAQNFMVYQYGASAGAVSQVSVANLKPNWVATGVRNGAGEVELIAWKSNGHALLRKGSATCPTVVENASVATVALTPNLVMTGAIYLSTLQVTPWSVSATGAVTCGAYGLLFTAASSVRMTKLDSERLVAATDGNGQLNLSMWAMIDGQIDNITGAPVLGSEGTIPAVAAVSPSWLVTAIRNGAGDLQLDSWFVTEGNAILHQATATAGGVSELDITAWDSGHVATPVRNSAGDLELIDWTLNTTTGAIVRESSITVGGISQVAASTIGSLVFSASLNSSGNVDAGVWGYDGTQIEAGASAPQEAGTAVAAAPLSTGLYSVTATRTAAGNLQVDVWSGDYVAP